MNFRGFADYFTIYLLFFFPKEVFYNVNINVLVIILICSTEKIVWSMFKN